MWFLYIVLMEIKDNGGMWFVHQLGLSKIMSHIPENSRDYAHTGYFTTRMDWNFETGGRVKRSWSIPNIVFGKIPYKKSFPKSWLSLKNLGGVLTAIPKRWQQLKFFFFFFSHNKQLLIGNIITVKVWIAITVVLDV